ncbi:MAG: DNA translocase FtsK [Lachnospiraceae bacterium]|nr:DNA translocase FtsK [Lachnospiraceae bacterium]
MSNNRKKTTTKKRTSSSAKKGQEKSQDFASFHTEIIIWITVIAAVLLLLGNFGFCGAVGNIISSIFFGTFGVVQHVLPVVILILVGLLFANQFSSLAIKKTILTILFFCMISVISQMFVNFDETSVFAAAEHAFTYHTGGGFIGGAVCIVLNKFLGKAASVIITVMIMLISLMLVFEKSILKLLKDAGSSTVKVSKEKIVERQQKREEKALEQKAIPGTFRDNLIEEKDAKKKPGRPKKKVVDIGEKFGLDTAFEQTGMQEPNGSTAEKKASENPEKKAADSISMDTFSWLDDLKLEELVVPESSIGPDTETVARDHSFEEKNNAPVEERVNEPEKKQTRVQKPAMDEQVSEQMKQDMDQAAKAANKPYIFPPYDLMMRGSNTNSLKQQRILKETAMKLQQTLANFGVNVTITDVSCGPSVTRYELQPEQGVKVSRILSLSDDIKLNLAAADIRIEAPIPGKAAIGIEVPNQHNEMVRLRDLIESDKFKSARSSLTYAVGKDIAGNIIVSDIAKMPHMLIAGATGSGKSVFVNTLITSVLYKADPKDVKFIMIDPKVVELSTYNGIPHLLIPVVTDPQKAAGALNWAVAEMTERYNKFAEYGVRNLEGYNKKVEEVLATGEVEPDAIKKLPQIIIIVDELADLMMVAPGEVEGAIVRLSQLARAAGIHLVIATQRPSVNVITGLIKANVPSRIAFMVSSGVDSRTILDMNGAEKLLGNGDMLFAPQGQQKPIRVQGAFISDKEVGAIVDFLKEQTGGEEQQNIAREVTSKIETSIKTAAGSEEKDELFQEAARFIVTKEKASIGMLQRMFKVGFNRASRIMEQLADAGIVGPEEGTKPRRILMSEDQLEQYFEEYL